MNEMTVIQLTLHQNQVVVNGVLVGGPSSVFERLVTRDLIVLGCLSSGDNHEVSSGDNHEGKIVPVFYVDFLL